MPLQKVCIILCCVITLSLSGCKGLIGIGENLLTGFIQIFIEDFFSDHPQKPDQTLPFTLQQGDHYQKIKRQNSQITYYQVTRNNGKIEYFSLDGTVLKLEDIIQPDFSNLNLTELQKVAEDINQQNK